MSKLYFIRHGQASAGKANYDQLSTLGYQQAERLGEYFLKHEIYPSKVYCGTLQRQKQSAESVKKVFEANGLQFPEIEVLKDFNEHNGVAILRNVMANLEKQDPEIQEKLNFFASQPKSNKLFMDLFEYSTEMWSKGRLKWTDDKLEDWPNFLNRIKELTQQITQDQKPKSKVFAFSSGGPVSAALGLHLNLNHQQIIELSWRVFNSSFTEYLFSENRMTLSRFNCTPHLTNKEDITLV